MTRYLIITVGVLFILLSTLTKCNRDLQHRLNQKDNTIEALTDTIKTVKNKKTDIISLQKTVFTQRLKSTDPLLNKSQQQLFKAVDKKTVAGVHMITKVVIRDVINYIPTLSDSTKVFTSVSDTLSYTITTKGDTLHINSLEVPNAATITFTEDKNKMVVNVTNSNPLMKTQDIQGYVLQKKKVTLWQKIKLLIL